MEKRVFSQDDSVSKNEPEQAPKRGVEPSAKNKQFQVNKDTTYSQDKREFSTENITIEVLEEDEKLEQQFEQSIKGKNGGFHKIIMALIVLFLAATTAQSVHWLVDTWQQGQWIYFLFAIISLSVIVLGSISLIKEWRRLMHLKRLTILKQQSEQTLLEGDVLQQDATAGYKLCLKIANNMDLANDNAGLLRWQKQINDGHNAAEITHLFSKNVLQDIDTKVKKLISHSAAESTVIVAVSPLAVVDMFFVAWRNLRLLNQIAGLYGIELGYFSRIRLLRMVLFNIAFAGATELVREVGMDWLSQNITAKLSARVAQGVGVGLLTARLGLKTMEFCRPVAFKPEDKPKLSIIHKELLTVVKSTILGKGKNLNKTSNGELIDR